MLRRRDIEFLLARVLCRDEKARKIIINTRSGSLRALKLFKYIKHRYPHIHRILILFSRRGTEESAVYALSRIIRQFNINEKLYVTLGDICNDLQLCPQINQ